LNGVYDLYLIINVQPHRTFSREGNNLVVEQEVPFSGAALGIEVAVPTLEGKKLKVKVGSPVLMLLVTNGGVILRYLTNFLVQFMMMKKNKLFFPQ